MSRSPHRERAQTQLMQNRGLLSQINPVVKRRSKAKNLEIPSEWGDVNGNAYRLLVGPNINKYVTPRATTSMSPSQKELEMEITIKKKEKLLNNLTPSRLKTPYKPFDVTVAQLDALQFPNDLLVQVAPPDSSVNYEILKRSMKTPKRPKTKIVRPHISETPPKIESQISTPRFTQHVSAEPSAFLAKLAKAKAESKEQEQEDITPETPKPQKKKKTLEEFMAKQRLKNVVMVRKMFYCLRCWASSQINAGQKSGFICDVENARTLISVVRRWHLYTAKKIKLRECQSKAIVVNHFYQTKVAFQSWKEKGQKAMKFALLAAKNNERSNIRLQRSILRIFRNVARSKRTARRDVVKLFRYSPNGPFRPVNEYYQKVRDLNIKALHFHFTKSIPPLIKLWREQVLQTKKDNVQIGQVHSIIRRCVFWEWFENYRDHFHGRTLVEIRKRTKILTKNSENKERETAEQVEKTVMIQLIHDRNILNAKLSQFDRLSQNHQEAVLRRTQMRSEITAATNSYFARQEELSLIDASRQAIEIERKTREIRMQLAEGFLYHLGRAVRSYDNQIVAHEFCLSFRVLSNPIVDRAVGYFYEKKHIKSLLQSAIKERQTMVAATKCVKLYHQNHGWSLWQRFIQHVNENRSSGLMDDIRRRVYILQLYPYFNWTEILPVRPPRPLKEVEQMFKDLPLVSIQRKVARERVHHVNVRMMLMKRRMQRDFLRAYASYVQEQIATRKVIMLLRKRRQMRLQRKALAGFIQTWKNEETVKDVPCQVEVQIGANIFAWHRHFFRERTRQRALVNSVPLS